MRISRRTISIVKELFPIIAALFAAGWAVYTTSLNEKARIAERNARVAEKTAEKALNKANLEIQKLKKKKLTHETDLQPSILTTM